MRELAVPGSYEITPQQHRDNRGVFLEWYRFDALQEAVGHPLNLRQANLSVSARGSVRGIHFADLPGGQAKYVTAVHGAVLDFVVDIRVGSPTFGRWDSVRLDDVDRKAVYVAEGLGHAFVALTEGAAVSYLVSGVYSPEHEHGLNPLDQDIALVFPTEAGEPLLSEKDAAAPGLNEAAASGLLPTWDAAQAWYDSLRED
jgi:dTDP-4-dehydrorhamnose 3,5-epimerase